VKKGFVSILIVNYKTKELTADCIRSLQLCCNPSSYEVIVIDNGSGDASVVYLKNLFSQATIIESEKNIGFGSANNVASKHANGEYIVTKDILPAFIKFYTEHKQLKPGVIGSLLIDEKGNVIHSGGKFSFPLRHFSFAKKNRSTIDEIKQNYFGPVNVVVGADMFMEKAVFDSFGGFDENIFLYEEELELQYRMLLKGYTPFLINEKAIIHLEGKSSGNWFKRRCSFISLCYVYKKHLPHWLYSITRLRMILFAFIFFKNPKTSWKEKVDYLKLSIFKK
jgi:GT2 family glycosyltransferase